MSLFSSVKSKRCSAKEAQDVLKALDKSQAVISFAPDGTILDANDLFLQVMGYEKEEIVGKHHKIFADPEYAKSPEYEKFWQELAQGVLKNEQFKRFNKAGKEVWIQASYNPVKDKNGKIYKVVKYATDITQQKFQEADFSGQIGAIKKSLAVIEFSMEGIILDANENFLNALGYTLEDVKGKHHSMFVDTAYRNSDEYMDFWRKLNKGEYQVSEYKRFGKNGREIWIQASYNPVSDINGKPFKIVKYATDITDQKKQNADYEGQLDAISRSQAVIQFDLDGKILNANQNFLDVVGYNLEEIKGKHHRMFVTETDSNSKSYEEFWSSLRNGHFHSAEYERVGKGGKQIWIQASYNPIFDLNGKPYKVVKYASDLTEHKEQKKRDLNNLAEKFQSNVQGIINSVAAASTELAHTSELMSDMIGKSHSNALEAVESSEETFSSVQTVAAASEEMSATIKEISLQTQNANNLISESVSKVQEADQHANELQTASQQVKSVMELISDISSQINLLALNATIESARAGEAGKGFAVVANEVRNLAGQTDKSIQDIEKVVQQMARASDSVISALKDIKDSVNDIYSSSTGVASAVEEQSAVVNDIAQNMNIATHKTQSVKENITSVSNLSDEAAQSSGQVMTAAQSLSQQSEQLKQEIEVFLNDIRAE